MFAEIDRPMDLHLFVLAWGAGDVTATSASQESGTFTHRSRVCIGFTLFYMVSLYHCNYFLLGCLTQLTVLLERFTE